MAKRDAAPAGLPAPYDEHLCNAMRALDAGKASEGQQKMALRWIIEYAARTYDQPYRMGEGGDRETAFACGRMFVGQQIVKIMKLVPATKPQGKA